MTQQRKTKIMARVMPQEFYRRALFSCVLAALMVVILTISSGNAVEPVVLDTSSGGNVTYRQLDSNIEVITGASGVLKLEASKGRLVRLQSPAATVFVADPEIANIQVKSPSLIYILGKKPGETTLYAVDAKERVLANVDIQVVHNLGRMQGILDELHPNSDVKLSSINGSIVLDGDVSSATESENIRRLAGGFVGDANNVINRLSITGPNQVNLRVRVAEVSRGVDKQLGFNWSILGAIGGVTLRVATANAFAATVTQDTVTTTNSVGGWDFNAVIDALEQEGLVTVLAEPNLTALSGETASFLAGGEFPILVPDGSGNVTIEFKKFGVSLAFTPTLLGQDRINMHVRPEVSAISTTNAITLNNFTVPSLTTRRAETTVELGSGQSFAIAGLLQNNVTHDISKFPGLGDIPVLGTLFKSDRFQRDESELVIIITPYIVAPVSNNKLASPTDGYVPPHDQERLYTSGINRRNPNVGDAKTIDGGGNKLSGPIGFQLD